MAYRSKILSPSNLCHIVPADTWHQPDPHLIWGKIEPEKCSMLKLNDDCLLELSKYLDLDALVQLSNVCTRFRSLLDLFYFSKIKIYSAFVLTMSVDSLRQTLKCIGPHLEAISLRYQRYINTPENYLKTEHEERATYKILQHIGHKLKSFTILKPQGQKPSNEIVKLFGPIFQQITTLKWDAEFDCETIQKLRSLCPCLETLKLIKRIFTCHCDHETTGLHWPSLKNVETFQYMSSLDSPCQRFFEMFIKSNPQLKRLKLANLNKTLFRVVAQFSENLEHLELIQNFTLCDIHSELTLDLIRNMDNLRVFVIRIKSTRSLKNIENQIKCLSQMKQLKLIVLLRNYFPPGCRRYSFPLAHYWSNTSVEGNQLTLQIGDNTANIDFSNEKSTLVNIINTNNPNKLTYQRLERDIQFIFGTTRDFFPELQQSFTFENNDCYQYIHVSSTV